MPELELVCLLSHLSNSQSLLLIPGHSPSPAISKGILMFKGKKVIQQSSLSIPVTFTSLHILRLVMTGNCFISESLHTSHSYKDYTYFHSFHPSLSHPACSWAFLWYLYPHLFPPTINSPDFTSFPISLDPVTSFSSTPSHNPHTISLSLAFLSHLPYKMQHCIDSTADTGLLSILSWDHPFPLPLTTLSFHQQLFQIFTTLFKSPPDRTFLFSANITSFTDRAGSLVSILIHSSFTNMSICIGTIPSTLNQNSLLTYSGTPLPQLLTLLSLVLLHLQISLS